MKSYRFLAHLTKVRECASHQAESVAAQQVAVIYAIPFRLNQVYAAKSHEIYELGSRVSHLQKLIGC